MQCDDITVASKLLGRPLYSRNIATLRQHLAVYSHIYAKSHRPRAQLLPVNNHQILCYKSSVISQIPLAYITCLLKLFFVDTIRAAHDDLMTGRLHYMYNKAFIR